MPEPKTSVAQAERRLYPRYQVQIPILIEPEGAAEPLSLTTSVISACGCSVMMADQLPLGHRLLARLSLGKDHVFIQARVITRHPQFGNGIMFLRFEGDGEDRLRRYLEGLS